jgi:predicted enzyme related to lactoylglutathione lyase
MFYIITLCFGGTLVLCVVPFRCNELDKAVMETMTSLAIISILVGDQDAALSFYTEKLGLEKRADVTYGPGMRWVTVAPKGQRKPEIALAKPAAQLHSITADQRAIEQSSQTISGVFDTEDCCKMYSTLLARGVRFLRPPTKQLYGMEAVFEDPYGNLFSLLEPSPEAYSMFKSARIGTAA